jgi:coenzyme F420-reducing hydrogenase beta subunit
MKYGRMSAKHIMFQVGSNVLENKETDDIMEKLEKLVEVAREKVPHTDILFGEILPRFYKDRRFKIVRTFIICVPVPFSICSFSIIPINVC